MSKQVSTKMAFGSLVMALLLMASAPLAAWGQQAKAGGTLRVAVWGDHTRNMDVRYLQPFSLYPAPLQIYESLVGYGPKGLDEIIPWLAESWKEVDPLTYLIYLRRGVKFHNGREMTAEDVKTWFEWNLKTPAGWMPLRRRAYLARIFEKAEMVERYTLRLRLKSPFVPPLTILRGIDQGSPLRKR